MKKDDVVANLVAWEGFQTRAASWGPLFWERESILVRQGPWQLWVKILESRKEVSHAFLLPLPDPF